MGSYFATTQSIGNFNPEFTTSVTVNDVKATDLELSLDSISDDNVVALKFSNKAN